MVFTVDHDQTLVGRQHPTTTTLTDNEKYEEPPSIMLRFIQKKPVSATTICVLILWLTVLVIVAMRTIDLEVERINLSTADIHKMILAMTNVTLSPLLKKNETSWAHNLQLPPIDMKRQKLLRNWLHQASNHTNNNVNNNNNSNKNDNIYNNEDDDSDNINNNNNFKYNNTNNYNNNINTNNNNINNKNNNNITTNEKLYETNNMTSHKLNVSQQYLTMKGKLKSFKLKHTSSNRELNKSNTEPINQHEVGTQHSNETIITSETNNITTKHNSRTRKRFSKYFQINPSEFEDLTLRQNNRNRHYQRKDSSIPNLLQSEIGPISKYNDTIKQNETLHKILRHKFQLPYYEKRSLKKTVFRTGPVVPDTTNPKEVQNAIGPVADYDGGDPDLGQDNDDWMFNFGQRFHDDEDG